MCEEAVWAWTPAQKDAFRRLKEMTSTAKVLAYYFQVAPTILLAYASSYGIGAISFQIQKKWSPGPRHLGFTFVFCSYSQIEKEALAMPGAFEKF